jgi:hypothetical protein
MPLKPRSLKQYHIFLASPGDVGVERQAVRKFVDEYNRHTASRWNARFDVIDWENCSTIGVGRPQELINRQTLEKYRDSLALVIGIMAQRFGSPSGKAESGTEEEFNVAMDLRAENEEWPEIKWFFRKIDQLTMPTDPNELQTAIEQWQKVVAFKQKMQDFDNPVFYTDYPSASGFADVLRHDLNLWLADEARPWADERAARLASGTVPVALPADFNSQTYREALLKRFDKLNFEMLDTTGAFYNSVRLWSVFEPQSVRECHQYNPRLLEVPKEHQQRMLDAGEITEEELAETKQQAERLRQDYFNQPLRPVLDVVDEALVSKRQKLVILGDPGSGKSSLIRYLALRWGQIEEAAVRDAQPIPLVIDLGSYARWQCDGQKGFVRFLEEAPVWHEWPTGLLGQLLAQPGRIVLLLDGLDEVFDVGLRDAVVNDITRFSSQFPQVPVLVTSRVVGYQPARLRDTEFRHFMLQDLDKDQITAFVNRWHEETFDDAEQAAPKRDRLLKAIDDSKSIAMLAGNPLLLTMMAILNRNQELPRDRVDLYAQASRVLLHQWDTERALSDFPGMSDHVGPKEKADILRRVAAHMQASPGGLKGNMIDGDTLTGLIEGYLQNELHITQSRAVVDHLRLRNFILCFIGADSYAFVHRTFLGYFCAADIVHQFNVAKTLSVQDLIALFDAHCRDDDWREVLRLICGQIDEQFVGRIVEHLATRTDLEKWDGKTPLPELPLAMWCLSELRSTARLAEEGDNLLSAVAQLFRAEEVSLAQSFFEEVIQSADELGSRYPGRRELPFSEALPSREHWHHVYWPKFVAAVIQQRSVVSDLVTCKQWAVRWGAVEALAVKWPDDTTRALLAQRAVQDDNPAPRRAALQVLAEKWPDETTRALLAQRAVQDDHESPRIAALQALAEKWPDETTRALLAQRAVHDDNEYPRRAALQALAEKWPDETTRELLAQRARVDGVAASVFGKQHSEFGRIVLTKHLNGYAPYLDPQQPVPREHIEKAAEKCGIPPEEVDAQAASLSEFLGWDITQGAKPQDSE